MDNCQDCYNVHDRGNSKGSGTGSSLRIAGDQSNAESFSMIVAGPQAGGAKDASPHWWALLRAHIAQ